MTRKRAIPKRPKPESKTITENGHGGKDGEDEAGVPHGSGATVADEKDGESALTWRSLNSRHLSSGIGVLLCVACGFWFTWYMARLHENSKWFSGIKPVARELSFRTESGLYYSYFKLMIKAPSISQGLYELRNDNRTEHLNTMNILQRFNIYQEVYLGVLYRGLQDLGIKVEPEIFYVRSIFLLHAGLVWALYLMTWMLSGSWLAGFLSVVFYTVNKDETTRVAISVPLRESFALPFWYMQLAILTWFLKPSVSKETQKSLICGLVFTTFCFALTWQFAQFVLLLQGFVFFGVGILDVVPNHKAASLLAVFVCQFLNVMILNSYVLSFIPAALIVMEIKSKYSSRFTSVDKYKTVVYFAMTGCYVVSSLVLMFVINVIFKFLIRQEADTHIFKFVLLKLGFGDPQDFDVRMYICTVSFLYMSEEAFLRMTLRFVFPIYAIALGAIIFFFAASLVAHTRKKKKVIREDTSKPKRVHRDMDIGEHWLTSDGSSEAPWFTKRPALIYHSAQSILVGILAVTTVRFKYLWCPYMCVLASVAVNDYTFWKWILGIFMKTKAKLIRTARHVSTLTVLLALIATSLPLYLSEIRYKSLYSNPPLTELVTWINKNTDMNAAFAGDMAIMASVRLVTWRPITNHPHYEDKALRHRTQEIYQIFAKRHPQEIHQILRKYDASYFIIEERHCHAHKDAHCAMPHCMDVSNGVIPDSGPGNYVGLKKSHVPRFCEALLSNKPAYASLFRLVFRNQEYRVYEIRK